MEKKPVSNDERDVLSCAAIIVAAGSGSRAAHGDDLLSKTLPLPPDQGIPLPAKQFWPLGPKIVLEHSLEYFSMHPKVATVILVLPRSEINNMAGLVASAQKPVHLVSGGATRQDSVRAGLDALEKMPEYDHILYVAIHDAARPLIPFDLLDRLMNAIAFSKNSKIIGAVPVLPLVDSIKTVGENQKNGGKAITGSIDRSKLAAAQTPQLFTRGTIIALHKRFAAKFDFSDDCSLAEAAGCEVLAIDGSKQLMKLTDAYDFALLEQWMARGTPRNLGPETTKLIDMFETRHGIGFDVHKFDQDAGPIWLGGIKLDSDRRMLAHSDGDVGLHALCDAIFGALADGDIGSHFPPSDPQWKSSDSTTFLAFAKRRVAECGGKIIHLDLTFICESPKISPHRDAMRMRIAKICDITVDRVSVKATTSEGLGFTGRGEGIAAQASVTITLPIPQGTSSNELSSTASRANQTSP